MGARLRVHAFSISVDSYAAGPQQDMANPLGVGGTQLHEWPVRDVHLSQHAW